MGKGGQVGKGGILSDDEVTVTAAAAAKGAARGAPPNPPSAPWWIRGGMEVNMSGMGLNVTVPAVLLAVTADPASLDGLLALLPWLPTLPGAARFGAVVAAFATLFALQVILAAAAHGMRGVFCLVAVPCYLTTLLILPPTLSGSPALLLVLAASIAIWRVGVCMSVCLHRYAAHAAFKCSPVTALFLNLLGSLAHQGGPIWWASAHRAHHKYCDVPGDPHSALLDGTEGAFSFFQAHRDVYEEFAPRHNDSPMLRLVDTWSFAVCTAEMVLAYLLLGRDGLFVSYTSMWLCQTITLWFNVANHPDRPDPPPPPGRTSCRASDSRAGPAQWYPAWILLDRVYPVFSAMVSEGAHSHHHSHSTLAQRDATDPPYWSFVYPLERMGLVWDVRKFAPGGKGGRGGGGGGGGGKAE